MKTPYFDSLIDNFGIWQHTDGRNILLEEGYSLDDAARGLLVCLELNKLASAESLYQYIQRSWEKDGFYGFATPEHKFIKFPASDDATAETFWALGYALFCNFRTKETKNLIQKLLPVINNFTSVRGYAYALLGAIYIDKDLARTIIKTLLRFFDKVDDNWFWPETIITYGNGIIPYAFLRYGYMMKDDEMAKFGLRILKFLDKKCQSDRLLAPIGNDSWLAKDQTDVPAFSQQPIDTAYMIWAWIAAFQYFHKPAYFQAAKDWWAWFDGKNIKSVRMFDLESLKCYDGIDKNGLNKHSGAESNICLLLSQQMLKTHLAI